jgi:hypothetical protein
LLYPAGAGDAVVKAYIVHDELRNGLSSRLRRMIIDIVDSQHPSVVGNGAVVQKWSSAGKAAIGPLGGLRWVVARRNVKFR